MADSQEKMLDAIRQVQLNQREQGDYALDLGNWADEMKAKEQEILKKKSGQPETEKLPPVRNTLDKKKFKKKRKKKPEKDGKPKRISGFDFKSWDKFDVDKALEEVDQKEEKKSSSEYETDEEWEVERKKHLANEEKNQGNSHLSAGAYEVAIECYTRGMDLDPSNALLPANRALALIKMEKYGAAEVDCTTAIMLDPVYVKAYLRRAAARVGLQRIAAALEDYQRVLQLEPTNKQAKAEVDRIKQEVRREMENSRPPAASFDTTESSQVKPVYKPPEQRSKKPLRRVPIEEIGVKDGSERKAAIAKTEALQSTAKKEAEAKDRAMFEKFTAKSNTDQSRDATEDAKVNGETESHAACPDEKSANDTPVISDFKAKIQEISQSESDATSDTTLKSNTGKTGKKASERPQKTLSGSNPSSPREGNGSASAATACLDKEPPQTSYQFQADFKVLKNHLPAFYAYFKRIAPELYPKVFGSSLEAPILLTIVEAIRQCSIPAQEDCYSHLKSLSEVKRFSMITMFLSPKEKQGIKEVFQYLKSKGDHPEADLDALMKKYEV